MRIIRNIVLLSGMSALGACSGASGDNSATPGQVAAVVNGTELTIYQVNSRLKGVKVPLGTNPKDLQSGALQSLIDEELLVQQALNKNIDRDPSVMQRLEQARRMILAQSYLERTTSGFLPPTNFEVREFYSEHPGLFSERRKYHLSEIAVESAPDAIQRYKDYYNSPDSSLGGLLALLRRDGVETIISDVVRNAEDLPLRLVPEFARMRVGDKAFYRTGNVLRFIQVDAIEQEPVSMELAYPRIDAFLRAERQKRAAQNEIAAMRRGAEIEYKSGFGPPRMPTPTDVKVRPQRAEADIDRVAVQRGLEGLTQ